MDYSILIVDDEGDIRKLMSLFLEMNETHTFTIYSAENGKKGINIYSKLTNSGRKPDIVLMDLRMPVMDGVEATRRIIESHPDANVYIFTAYTKTEVEQDALIAGARGTLSKDVDWNRTIANVVNILESL
uniref:Chemotaxis protein CheY n=1 Tax=Candidatus Methanogaster sp. ANME-2c ERB4 TaxID=2759911 RepID=A0A7G9YQC2_9EURY|nr:chemotaxis protein CheY [Methanosarcinales archaeon ANME-2c ERB4]QNO50206.1 chemotaxis protein CheY [Methanosarcinales archaeon ANME-2c ERB4]